jgi:hypothetical protein
MNIPNDSPRPKRLLWLRAPICLLLVLFVIFIMREHPWDSPSTSSYSRWAFLHVMIYIALALCVALCPFRRGLAVVPILLGASLVATYLAAFVGWDGGNDGGGWCWILIVGPSCLLACILCVGWSFLMVAGSSAAENRR